MTEAGDGRPQRGERLHRLPVQAPVRGEERRRLLQTGPARQEVDVGEEISGDGHPVRNQMQA